MDGIIKALIYGAVGIIFGLALFPIVNKAITNANFSTDDEWIGTLIKVGYGLAVAMLGVVIVLFALKSMKA